MAAAPNLASPFDGANPFDGAIRPELSRFEQETWCSFVERRCGTSFADGRIHLLHASLWEEMQRLGIVSFGEYYAHILRSASDWHRLLERFSNHETYFFRHMPSFLALSEEILPLLAAERLRQGAKCLTLWSAGCSSGEEAWSMAIAAKEAAAGWHCEIQVLGSDLSRTILTTARRARYGRRSVAAMPEELRRQYLIYDGVEYEVRAGIRNIVRFDQFNLFERSTYPTQLQDVIFCQNVFIYFRDTMRARAVSNLADCLAPGGFLVPAPGEVGGLRIPGLELVRLHHTTVLRRTAAPTT